MNKKPKSKLILILIISVLTIGLSYFAGYMTGDLVADKLDYIALVNDDQFEMFGAIVEHDYDVKLINSQIDYTNGTGWLLVRSNENGEVYIITAKVEKIDSRYEWVVVEEFR